MAITCQRPQCKRPVFPGHPFCGKRCATLVKFLPTTFPKVVDSGFKCLSPNCTRKASGAFEYCSRSCSTIHGQTSQIYPLYPESLAYKEVSEIFNLTASARKISSIYSIKPVSALTQRFLNYQKTTGLIPCVRFHGTVFKCGLDLNPNNPRNDHGRPMPCEYSTCSVCGIIKNGLLLSCSPGGLYSARSASTSLGYSAKGGWNGYQAMFLCHVLDSQVNQEAIGIHIEEVVYHYQFFEKREREKAYLTKYLIVFQ